ncbi:mast cell protease 1A-like [Emydura macquarii macquarii]|uniref:mast cell protease 1A-like n=1 Tax=Emydura macquarii macquarii TaxID=1129001 RepID=UPI00352BA263
MLLLLLLPMAFPQPPGALAGEIIGGQEARPHSRPYMAFVNIDEGGGGGRCGGFLIREDVVVTAAHCNCNLGNITVLLGAHNIAIEEPGRQEIRVRRRIPHPDYNDETFENDIMLLELECLAQLNEWVRPIALPKVTRRVEPGTRCSVAGWGLTGSDPAKTSNVLMEVELGVKVDKFCTNLYGKGYKSETMLCAGSPEAHQGTLQGDSGGPLVCDEVAQGICSWEIVNSSAEIYTRVSHFVPWIKKVIKRRLGIVSYGRADRSVPSVFTRISKYVSWIKKTLCKLKP